MRYFVWDDIILLLEFRDSMTSSWREAVKSFTFLYLVHAKDWRDDSVTSINFDRLDFAIIASFQKTFELFDYSSISL